MTDDEMKKLLATLIDIPTDESEGAQTEVLKAIAEKHGATVHIDEVTPGRFNFSADFSGDSPGKSLMLEAHGDTVPGTQKYRYDTGTDRVYGRGSCDTKGALVAMLAAILRARSKKSLRGTVRLMSSCREETGGEGARAIAASDFRPDMTVIGEPTKMEIVRANKGAWHTRVTTRGLAVHSSNPSAGINAISEMCAFIRALEIEFIPYLSSMRNPLLGSPTLSVGTIRGGKAVNVVPDECSIEVDWRLIPETRADELLERLRARFPGAAIEPYEFYPPFLEPDDSATLALMARAVEEVTGKPAVLAGAPWAANAGILQYEAGFSCVLFGPGDIAQAHTAQEYVPWSQVTQAAKVYERMLEL
ncbi:MAG: M20/M25/M40 family metallo-hydrolase [Treponemataceae bacterium]